MNSTAQQNVILGDLLDGFTAALTPESAQRLTGLKAGSATQARLDELASKCNEGELSEAEQAEYEAYVRVGNFLNIVKAKAKKALKESP